MAKRSGGTRQSGSSTGGVVQPAVDQYAAWRAVEGSERFTYDRDKVKFKVESPLDMSDTPFTASELRHRSDYEFYAIQRDMGDGKYHINDGEYIYNEPRTFNQAVQEAVRFSKERYQNNEGMRDQMYQVRNYDDDNAPSAWVTAELVGDNKVQIRISRFKP